MANPVGVTVTSRTTPPSRGIPTATDGLFLVAVTDVGTPGTVETCHDLGEFEAAFGPRSAGNVALWDYADIYFREGGRRLIVSPSAAAAGLDNALGDLSSDLGPGQVAGVGFTTADHGTLREFGNETNRFAILDTEVDDDEAAATTLGDAMSTDPDFGALFFPWTTAPGPVGVTGVATRQVPASATVAALCSRVDQTGNPNQAAAGRWLPLQYASGLVKDIPRSSFADLLDHAVNPIAEIFGVLEVYGFQTGVEQAADNPLWQANCARMRMALVAESQAIGENYMFRPIDGKGLLANALAGDLSAMMLRYYNLNALYGEDPEDAYSVLTSPVINPVESIAQGTLKATAEVILSLHAKSIQIELVTVPVGGSVVQ